APDQERQPVRGKPHSRSASKVPGMRLQMNRLEHAVGIFSTDSRNTQCRIRHHLRSEVHKRNASVGCHSWRVSEAFTRWSSNLGLFFVGVLTTVPCMTPILPSSILNSSRIRPKKWAFLLKDPFFGPNSRLVCI